MSYILEALRKAEAERRRGAVPDLHAQVLPAGAAVAGPAPARSSLPLWLGGAALLAAVAAAGWLWLGRQEPPARVVAESPAPPPKMAMPAPADVPPPQPQAPPSAPAAVAAAPPPKAPAPVRKAQPAAKRDAPVASKTPKQPTAPPAQPEAAPPPVEPARVPALAELPGDLRQQVPALAIGGSVYSPQASARMVVVNGQVFQEGNALTPELKLEQIRPKSAVFSIRGTRFEVPL